MSNENINKTIEDLVKLVLSNFYNPIHLILFEALLRHRGLKDDVLAEKLHLDPVFVRQNLLQLQNIRLIDNKSITEKTDSGRNIVGSIYSINFPSFINVVKFSLKKIEKMIEQDSQQLIGKILFIDC